MARHKSEAADRRRLGAEIARRMAVASMRPSDLAVAAGIDDSQMSKVLSGRTGLSLYSLQRVADALRCTRSEILAAADVRAQPVPAARVSR